MKWRHFLPIAFAAGCVSNTAPITDVELGGKLAANVAQALKDNTDGAPISRLEQLTVLQADTVGAAKVYTLLINLPGTLPAEYELAMRTNHSLERGEGGISGLSSEQVLYFPGTFTMEERDARLFSEYVAKLIIEAGKDEQVCKEEYEAMGLSATCLR